MARTTKQLSGGGKDKFLRGIVASVAAAEAVDALTAALSEQITEVRVRREAWEASKVEPAAAPAELSQTRKPTATPAPPSSAETFDPFAFSVVALLAKKGKPALLQALETVHSAEHLRRLADAQHLAVETGVVDVAGLRAAIALGAERRIAERKAAAS